MEPECLEPLNLVIKKDDTGREETVIEEEQRIGKSNANAIDEEEEEEESTDSRMIENNDVTTILQDACKAGGESGLPIADQKILTALYMSSLMNMSNASTLPRNVTSSPPYAAQHNLVQLLAMLEARHRVWQQMNNWPTPQNFLRNPLGLPPQPYFADSPSANQLTEQLCTSQNPAPSFPLSSAKAEPSNHETTKQAYFKRSTIEQKNSASLPADNAKNQDTGQQNNQDKKKPHIKKPLNAFMLYMKEMRAKVVAECTLKESAAINQILGRRWHSLSRDEQARYYEAARQERHLHQQLYPGWSARDNYGYGSKKKKRKKERSADPTGGNNMKKCRARYGLDQQSQWCKPCSPVEHGAGMGIHASIIHHGVGSSAGSGVGAGGGGGTVGATTAPPNTNTASNTSSPQQEPTYVNL
ncbi:hypothetical protein M0802_006919 [Mischocyttarus mexicanus]|nr:hypothetical protein M0802_006919 [Mischocyttarus mexicanus]